MPVFANENRPKYLLIELGFLIFLAYFISLISDLEYSYYEQHDIWKFVNALEYRLVYGTAEFILYAVFYWLLIKPNVFARRARMIIVSLILFIVVDHYYISYGIHWLVGHSNFLSEGIRTRAMASYALAHLSIPVNYTLVIAVFPLTGFAFVMRSIHQDTQIQNLKEQQLVTELSYLKAQLHPHFFFNTLNNIYALALNQSDDTAPMVAKLGEMMRYILYEADKPVVALSREIHFLSNYAETQKMRYGSHHRIEFTVQGDDGKRPIEPLLLLPFAENAFKHGLEEETGKGFISIVLCVTETELILEVSNSKPKRHQDVPNGIGLENVAKRLVLLYPERHRLTIRDGHDEYNVSLMLTFL